MQSPRRSFIRGAIASAAGIAIGIPAAVAASPLQIWGEKTLSPVPSALERVSVRHLMVAIQKSMDDALAQFEYNDAYTRANITELVAGYLRNLEHTGVIGQWMVMCDERNNPPTIIAQNECIVNVSWRLPWEQQLRLHPGVYELLAQDEFYTQQASAAVSRLNIPSREIYNEPKIHRC